MSFEPGGLADKLGNRYEGRWVAKQLLRLLNEEISSVTIEAIGDSERGVDIWIEKKDGIRQAQQCKARNASREYWSLKVLKSRGILDHLRFQLDRSSGHEFAFVSAIGATMFQDLCESARQSTGDPEDFYNYQIRAVGAERLTGFRQICDGLQLDFEAAVDRAKVFNYLRRSWFILYPDDDNMWQSLIAETGYLLTGEPKLVVSTLLTYAENSDRFRRPIYADELRTYLAKLGVNPKRLSCDTRIVPAIEELCRQFEESIQPRLIGGKIIPREETRLLLNALESKNDIVLHGAAGYGKTGVLYEMTGRLRETKIPFLPIRLDRREPSNTAFQFGQDMGLPDSPVHCLAGQAGDRFSVLILDQLDAIRWTSAHSANALDVCKEILRQVQSLRQSGKRILAVVCCRTFDLEHDPEIRSWLTDPSDRKFIKIQVKELEIPTLQVVVGPALNDMTDQKKRILSCPQNLAMWMELETFGAAPDFQSSMQLMRCFWENRRLVLEKSGINSDQVGQFVNAIIDYVEQQGKISAPERIVAKWPKITEALCSLGIIYAIDKRVTFCHQSYLDYLIADRLTHEIDKGSGNIIDWLGSKERQSLFRREQLRQVLAMLEDDSLDRFVAVAKDLLASDRIRFHLKHLVLEIIGQLQEMSKDTEQFCLSLLDDDSWREHARETIFFGHAPQVTLLIDRGITSGWLNSGIEEEVNRALWLLRSVSEKVPDLISGLLEPFVGLDREWSVKVLSTICWNPVDDSDQMFQTRLRLARLGIVSNFIEWKTLSSRYPLRALYLIESVMSTWNIEAEDQPNKLQSGLQNRMENWYEDDIKALLAVAEQNPAATWDMLFPHIERLTAFEAKPYDPRMEEWQEDRFLRQRQRKTHTAIKRGIVEMLIVASGELAAKYPDDLLGRTIPVENSVSPVIQEIIVSAYSRLPAIHADSGIRWLLSDSSRLGLGQGYNEPQWMPAARLITALSSHCSEELFRKLEDVLVHYHSADEKRVAEYYLKGWREGFFGHYWGQAQYFLLPSLDQKRILQSTASLIAVLKRRYADYREEHFLRGGRGSGGLVGSKIDVSLDRISDRAWISIVSNKRISGRHNYNSWKQIDEDHVAVSSTEQFSRSLAIIAKRFPERFGQLLLHFPQDVHPWYVSAIFDAFGQKKPQADAPEHERTKWQPASHETMEKALEKFELGDDRETALSFCRLISERADENWSNKTIKRLVRFAISHPDLEPGKLNVSCNKTADEASVDTLFQNTINCVRGVAAEAIGQLLWNRMDWLEKVRPAIESLVNDPHPAVRMASIDALLPVLNIDKDLAVEWFCKACTNDLRVAASPKAVFFFNNAVSSNYDSLGPIIRAMVKSPIDEVAQEGAEEVTARWLFHGFFEQDLARCQNGNLPQRKGVAQIVSHFLSDAKYAAQCKDLIGPLINDPEKDVRNETTNLFHSRAYSSEVLDVEFVKSFVRSKTFADHPYSFVDWLKNFPGSLVPLADVVFTVCEVFSTTLREKSREIGTDVPYTVSEACTLLLRLYEQSHNSNYAEITNRCLDAWDELFQNRVGIVREISKTIER